MASGTRSLVVTLLLLHDPRGWVRRWVIYDRSGQDIGDSVLQGDVSGRERSPNRIGGPASGDVNGDKSSGEGREKNIKIGMEPAHHFGKGLPDLPHAERGITVALNVHLSKLFKLGGHLGGLLEDLTVDGTIMSHKKETKHSEYNKKLIRT